ncbi:hypothetical protein Tco_0597434 [Tanacetum coccineum]
MKASASQRVESLSSNGVSVDGDEVENNRITSGEKDCFSSTVLVEVRIGSLVSVLVGLDISDDETGRSHLTCQIWKVGFLWRKLPTAAGSLLELLDIVIEKTGRKIVPPRVNGQRSKQLKFHLIHHLVHLDSHSYPREKRWEILIYGNFGNKVSPVRIDLGGSLSINLRLHRLENNGKSKSLTKCINGYVYFTPIKEDEITNEVYELKRREKGKIVEEFRSTPLPTPIRSPMTHTNLMKFENLQVLQTISRPSAVRPRDQDDPHDDAHPERENNSSCAGQVNEEERGPSTSGNQEQEDDYDFWTDSYASDDDEIPSKQVSQDIMEEVSLTIDEAKLKKMADEMLRQRCTLGDEHHIYIDLDEGLLKNPEAPALSLINQDLLYLKKGSSGPEKIVLSLHKFPAIIFNDDDIEERTSRWVNKCVKKFNPYARYGVEHWKNPHAKIFYIRKQKEPRKPKEEVYSNSKIIQVTQEHTRELDHEHKFVTEIDTRRANECIVLITEPDYKNLNKNDIEDMYLLIMNSKVPDYTEIGLLWSLSIFIRSSVIWERVHDFQLGIESYQQKVNLTAPTISFPGVEKTDLFSLIYELVHGSSYTRIAKKRKSYADVRKKPLEFQVGDKVMLKVSPWKGVIRFGKRGKLNPRYIRPFKIITKVGTVAYCLELPEKLSRVHSTFHVSKLKKCMADEPLAIPLDEIRVDDKLNFIEEPVEIMDHEVKRLKQSRILIVKVRSNSMRGPEFTWEREDQMQKKYLYLFTNSALAAEVAS